MSSAVDRPDWAKRMPTRPAGGEVIDAEVVQRPAPTRAVHAVATRVRHSPVCRRTGRATMTHSAYILLGITVAAKRLWEAHSVSRYERMQRIHEAAGHYEMVADWEEREARAKQRRHDRIMDWIKSPLEIAKAGLTAAAGLAVVLLVLGIMLAVADGEATRVVDPIVGVIEAARWAAWFLGAFGVFILLAAALIGAGILWYLGKHHTKPPLWAMPMMPGPDRDVVPDERAIMQALANLGHAPLDRAFKEGWQPRWMQGTVRVGNGWHTQLLLPPGVPVGEIADRKERLAHNFLRAPLEVWPTEPPDKSGVLDLWVADQGVLSGPVEPWPLLHEGTTDWWRGVPVAVDAKGDRVRAQLMARNYLIAGTMGSGKSSLVITLALGAMLDPLVEIDIYCMAHNVDFDAMQPRLRVFMKGDEDEHIEAGIRAMRDIASEITRRGQRLDELGGDDAKVTRDIATREKRMRPRLVIFDEAHELFTHGKYGKEAKELALKITKKARKTGISFVWSTPDADAASLPRGISKTTSNRVAFAINDHQGNDSILGTGMHRAGYSATTLVAGEDVGTAMAAGFASRPGLIRCHHVRRGDGVDEVSPVVARAMALRGEHKVDTDPDVATEPASDPLDDIAEIMQGRDRMLTREVLQQLIERDHAAYSDWYDQTLTEYLRDHDAAPYKSDGKMYVPGRKVRRALDERDH